MEATRGDEIVMVVEDDDSMRGALSRLIRSVGLAVETFTSAQEFLDCQLPKGPCCLVLDIRLPGLSGLQLQETLTAQGMVIPIIFITGHGDVPMSVQAMKAGAVDFLQKPVNDQQLLDAVHRALSRDRQERSQRDRQEAVRRRYRMLTPREQEVLSLVVSGCRNKEIAVELDASERTVKVHRARVMEKMGAESLPDLVRLSEMLKQDRSDQRGLEGVGRKMEL